MSSLAHDDQFVRVFITWLSSPSMEGLEELELRITGALCLGNLSRSDDCCFHLVKVHKLGDLLVTMLMEETRKFEEGQPGSSSRLLQGIASALKNLSLSGVGLD